MSHLQPYIVSLIVGVVPQIIILALGVTLGNAA